MSGGQPPHRARFAPPDAARFGPRDAARLGRPDAVRLGPPHLLEAGQATVELVALLPLIVVVGLAAGQLFAAGAAHELAGNAAEAGAAAMLQGGDPRDAARAALPGRSRERAVLQVDGRRIRVRLRPRRVLPGLVSRLTATATADAGPPPSRFAATDTPTAPRPS